MEALCGVELWRPCVRSSCGGPVWGRAVEALCEVKLSDVLEVVSSSE